VTFHPIARANYGSSMSAGQSFPLVSNSAGAKSERRDILLSG